MKIKALLILLFFGLTQICNAQADKYGILIETFLDGFQGWNGSHAGNHRVTVGSKTVSKGSNTKDEAVVEYDFFYVTDNPTVIRCSGSTAGNKDGSDCDENKTIPYNPETFDSASFSGCIGSSDIMGIYLPQPSGTNICKEDVISLTRGWNWEYSFEDTPWTSFPNQYQSKRNISFKLKDLAGYDGKKRLNIRTGYKTQFTSSIFYDIIPCAPGLIGEPELKKTTCIYKNDGKATFSFNRDIADNEHFLFNVYQKSNGQLIKSPTVLQTDFPDRKYTFTDLPKGTYYLIYQSFIGTQQTSVNQPPYPEFTIGSESPVNYQIFDTQPICNNEPGQIRLEVSGGTEPYYYTLNSNAEVQFTSPINITVTSGDYSIKVRDKYSCIDQNANQ
ncbi:hypothetical protein RT99_08090 [Flavobacterium sp. MEB061]|uniref:hypothetical protein n=1 Tax=Flavobacterium sp. MEB061 TaxID=1587524 RepID=UPI0005AC1EF6|nr:hypothetical protein [Flavobacterium sp. MEB061]KIQ22148.1 hypothetical protein RT99_08090 [Flavobacterium sp. MEB061]